MENKFLVFINQYQLIKKGDRLLVAVSGGADSVVLLYLLHKLSCQLGLSLQIAHVNYGLRSSADEDQALVEALARQYELPFHLKKVETKLHSNIEETARIIRYDFFREILQSENLDKVALGHNQDDRVETFLLNLSRGSGLDGLTALRPCRNELIRPLLSVKKAEIKAFARSHGLEFREDSTNNSLKFKRNILRLKIIPEFQKINSAFVDNVLSEIELLSSLKEMIGMKIDWIFPRTCRIEKEELILDLTKLKTHPRVVQAEIIRKGLAYVAGSLKNVTRKNISQILEISEKPYGTRKICLPGGLISTQVYDKVIFSLVKETGGALPAATKLPCNTETVFLNFSFSYHDTTKRITQRNQKNLVFIDKEKAKDLLVRLKRPGDRIAIGPKASKKLQDLFVDLKIPRAKRGQWPVVASGKEIVWVPGIRLSENFRVTKTTRTIGILRIESRSKPKKEKNV